MMSAATGEADEMCASCGVPAGDDIKLKNCTACYLVKYCSIKCQKEHRSQHKRACKKRAAELRDELLFKQPESTHLGDCPICFIPLPPDPDKFMMMACCCKVICLGCAYADLLRQLEGKLGILCAFCRQPRATSEKETDRNYMKRIEAGDPVAMRQMGAKREIDGDYSAAFEYWTKAAKLGDAESHNQLAIMYQEGNGVEKDEGKEIYHLEVAAIAGHPGARFNLAIAMQEGRNGWDERSVKHLIIGANLGHDMSIEMLKESYTDGDISKVDYAAALRAYQAAIDATKSPQRGAALDA